MVDRVSVVVAPDQSLLSTLQKDVGAGVYAPGVVPVGATGQALIAAEPPAADAEGLVVRVVGGAGGGGATGGLTDAELRSAPVPVSGTVAVSGTLPVSGPVTDTQLRASPVPVSGTFWPGTQPISAAVLPLPTGAGTEATLAAIKAKTDNLDVLLSTRTKPQDTQPVSGTFWPATQPVSAVALPLPTGAATDGALITGQNLEAGGSGLIGWLSSLRKAVTDRLPAALVGGRLDVNVGASTTVPVSGTFWQATQPVSGPLTDAQMRASAVPVSGAFFQATQPVSAAALPLPTGAATEATLAARLPAPVAKGVQGATGQATQDLKDSGRTRVVIKATAVAGATSETLVSLVKSKDGVEAAGATTIPVTAGKTLRLTALVLTWRNNTAALGAVQVHLRENPTGAAIVSSPIVLTAGVRSAAATIGDVATVVVPIPDGMEFGGANQLAVTQLAIGAVVGFDVQLIGFEY